MGLSLPYRLKRLAGSLEYDEISLSSVLEWKRTSRARFAEPLKDIG